VVAGAVGGQGFNETKIIGKAKVDPGPSGLNTD